MMINDKEKLQGEGVWRGRNVDVISDTAVREVAEND